MHFWIDKRSQCAYSGRHRVSSSLSTGVGRSRGRVCAAAGRKGMAAPVHRFAPVDCAPRRPRSLRNYGPPPMPAVHSTRRQNDESSLYVEIPPEPPQPTIASLAAARSVTPDTLLRTAALGLQQSTMLTPHLKCGILVVVSVTTLAVASSKLYFDLQARHRNANGENAGEGGLWFMILMCIAIMGAALAVCGPRQPLGSPPAPPERVSSTARRPLPRTPLRVPADLEATLAEPEEILLTTLSRTEREVSPDSGEAPPPYHIAVLLPSRASSPPPPAYSALS